MQQLAAYRQTTQFFDVHARSPSIGDVTRHGTLLCRHAKLDHAASRMRAWQLFAVPQLFPS
jgi:hypothetical protein